MNIKEAKTQVKNGILSYLTKDLHGEYIIPIEKQRPMFLIGPPGIGKTAIMEQIAQEMNLCLLSYSITHHTRQSALGLPFITKKKFDGKEYSISEYTMSEIIASVYEVMEETGLKEGILFLDEINCVSETLTPAMLQFLQYKIFGKHRVPKGWVVITAGNPPEYNNSVHEFDIVTMDRLKKIDITPDFSPWKEYAVNNNIHSSIMGFLSQKPDYFYSVTTSVEGKEFVTARGWEDLSVMIRLYEHHQIPVDIALISQYIQDTQIARDFSIYFELYNKYKLKYQISEILKKDPDKNIIEIAKKGQLDERLAVIDMIVDELATETSMLNLQDNAIKYLLSRLKPIIELDNDSIVKSILNLKSKQKMDLNLTSKAVIISEKEKYAQVFTIDFISQLETLTIEKETIRNLYSEKLHQLKIEITKLQEMINHGFEFIISAYGQDKELIAFVTELTIRKSIIEFISNHGCENYFKYNKSLLLDKRQDQILSQIDNLEI